MKGHIGEGVNKRKTILVTSLIATQLLGPAFCAPVQTESRSEWSDSKGDHGKEDHHDEAVEKALEVHQYLSNGVEGIAEAAHDKVADLNDRWTYQIEREADKIKDAHQRLVDEKDHVGDIKDALLYGTHPNDADASDVMEKRGIILISNNQQPSIQIDASNEDDEDGSDAENQDAMQDQIDLLNKLKASGVIDVDQLQKPTEVVEEDGNDMAGPHLLILGVPAGPMKKRCDNSEKFLMDDEDENEDDEDEDEDEDDEEEDEGCDSLDKRGQDETELMRRGFYSNLAGSAVGTYAGSVLHDKWKKHKAKKRAKKARRDRRNGKNRGDDDDDYRDYYKRSPVFENNGKAPVENGPSTSGTGAGHEGAAPPPPPPTPETPPPPPPPPPPQPQPQPQVEPSAVVIPKTIAGKPVKVGDNFMDKTGKVLTAIGAVGGVIYLVDKSHQFYRNYAGHGDDGSNAKRDVIEDASEYEILPEKRAIEYSRVYRREEGEESDDDDDEEYFDADGETLERRAVWNWFGLGGGKPMVEKPVTPPPAANVEASNTSPPASLPVVQTNAAPPTPPLQPVAPQPAVQPGPIKQSIGEPIPPPPPSGPLRTEGEQKWLAAQRANAISDKKTMSNHLATAGKVVAGVGALGLVTGTAYTVGRDNGRDDDKYRSQYQRRAFFGNGSKRTVVQGEKKVSKPMSTTKKVLAAAGAVGVVGTAFGVGKHFGRKDERKRLSRYSKREDVDEVEEGEEEEDDDDDDFGVEMDDEDDFDDEEEGLMEKRWFNWGRGEAKPMIEEVPQKTTLDPVVVEEVVNNDTEEKKSSSALGLTAKVAAGLGAAGLVGAAGYGTAKFLDGGNNDDNTQKRSLNKIIRRDGSDDYIPIPDSELNAIILSSNQAAANEKVAATKTLLMEETDSVKKLPDQGEKVKEPKSKGDIVINSNEVTINQ